MPNPVHHPAGTTIQHAPSDNTKPYVGVVSGAGGTTLTITYMVEGEPYHKVYEWADLGAGIELWLRNNFWRRVYYDDGTYKVWQGALLIESGTYTTSS